MMMMMMKMLAAVMRYRVVAAHAIESGIDLRQKAGVSSEEETFLRRPAVRVRLRGIVIQHLFPHACGRSTFDLPDASSSRKREPRESVKERLPSWRTRSYQLRQDEGFRVACRIPYEA